MAMNPLPPQAYTKDTLLRAYAWLQNQNNNIKEMATTPDILVSLYLKATRDGDSALDRPSIQNFKSELKSLAGLMGELEKDQAPPPLVSAAPEPPPERQRTFYDDPPMNHGPSSQREYHEPPPPQPPPFSQSRVRAEFEEPPPRAQHSEPPPRRSGISLANLDAYSLEMLNEVQQGFNLSDQTEALRMVIKLGYLKARKILTE